jgi:hypothetical protein
MYNIDMEDTKICKKCNSEYPIIFFNRDLSRKDGLFPWCNNCKKQSGIKSYHKNREKNHQKRKEWRENNKDIKRQMDKDYRGKLKARNISDIVVPKTKVCPKCLDIKQSKDYFKNSSSKDYLSTYCKDCTKDKTHTSYETHKEKRKISQKQYCEKNKEAVKKRKQDYYVKKNKEIKEYKKKWAHKNKDKIVKRQLEYRKNNREKLNLYHTNRKKEDIEYRVLCSLRIRLCQALHRNKKSDHTMNLIGCSTNELVKFIESHFSCGMSWENYGTGNGKWSIDHTRPCSSFDLSIPEQQEECFNYSNLRPMWNIDNFKKNSLYNGQYIRRKKQ